MSSIHSINSPVIMPVVYLGNISWYKTLLSSSEVTLEKHEHFVKQTFRNRCYIAGPNGKHLLVIPVVKGKSGHTVIKDVRISYDERWQAIHWRSLEAGYRRSPYFEYYEDGLRPFYENKEEFLLDFNFKLHEKIMSWLKTEVKTDFTQSYHFPAEQGIDLRNGWEENAEIEYMQVFSNRNGFIHNLSIVDLIFNEGPRAMSFLV